LEGADNSKNKILMIVIVAMLVILLVAVVFIAIMLLRMPDGSEQGGSAAAAVDLRPDQLELIEFSQPISTNIRGETGTTHVIRTGFIVAVDRTQGRDSNDAIALLSESDSIMRSVALHVVRGRTFEELSHPEAMALLEQDLLDQLRIEFSTNLIHRVMVDGNWFLD